MLHLGSHKVNSLGGCFRPRVAVCALLLILCRRLLRRLRSVSVRFPCSRKTRMRHRACRSRRTDRRRGEHHRVVAGGRYRLDTCAMQTASSRRDSGSYARLRQPVRLSSTSSTNTSTSDPRVFSCRLPSLHALLRSSIFRSAAGRAHHCVVFLLTPASAAISSSVPSPM